MQLFTHQLSIRRDGFNFTILYTHVYVIVITRVPYRTKFRRTKVPKIWFCAENFVRRKILSAENSVRRNILFQLHQMVENMMEKRITTKLS